jgi:hypothetical protein
MKMILSLSILLLSAVASADSVDSIAKQLNLREYDCSAKGEVIRGYPRKNIVFNSAGTTVVGSDRNDALKSCMAKFNVHQLNKYQGQLPSEFYGMSDGGIAFFNMVFSKGNSDFKVIPVAKGVAVRITELSVSPRD